MIPLVQTNLKARAYCRKVSSSLAPARCQRERLRANGGAAGAGLRMQTTAATQLRLSTELPHGCQKRGPASAPTAGALHTCAAGTWAAGVPVRPQGPPGRLRQVTGGCARESWEAARRPPQGRHLRVRRRRRRVAARTAAAELPPPLPGPEPGCQDPGWSSTAAGWRHLQFREQQVFGDLHAWNSLSLHARTAVEDVNLASGTPRKLSLFR